MEIESSLVAAQNALTVNPAPREPQREAEARQEQTQRQSTELPRTQVVVRQGSSEAFEQADRFRQNRETGFDQPSGRARNAIAAYQSLETEQRRSEIQELFGVDTFA